MNPVKTFGTHTLYVTTDNYYGALKRLGPTGDFDEAVVKVFADTLAEMIECGGVFTIKTADKATRIERISE